MEVLFLDFDGVLVTEQSYFYWERQKDRKRSELNAARCCPVAISNLNYLCTELPDLRIVISSTWRRYHSLKDLQTILEEDGFTHKDRIIDVTPRRRLDGEGRGTEIAAWLDGHKKVTDWVAIDDHQDNIPEDHIILTRQEVGFMIDDAYQIIERFKKKWKRPLFLM